MCSSEDSESLLTQQLSSGFPKFYMHSGISFKEFRLSVSCDGSIAIDETYKAPLVNVALIRLQFHTFHAPPFFWRTGGFANRYSCPNQSRSFQSQGRLVVVVVLPLEYHRIGASTDIMGNKCNTKPVEAISGQRRFETIVARRYWQMKATKDTTHG